MISRRTFLSLTSLSPLAQCLGETARRAVEGASRPRFVFFLQGNGIYPHQLQPPAFPLADKPSELADRSLAGQPLPPSIAPLENHRHRITIVHGLSSRIAGPPPHSADFGALGCFPQRNGAYAETVDAALAAAHPGIFSHVGLGVSGERDANVIYNVSAAGRNTPLPTHCQPSLAYARLFASAATGDARKAFDARTNVLDFLAGDVRRLGRNLDGPEKEKLGHYLHALEAMGQRQAKLAETTRATSLDPTGFPHGVGGFDHLDAQLDIAASSLIAGLTNVTTISSGSGLGFLDIAVDGADLGFTPGPVNLHGIGHGTGFCGQAPDTLHTAIQKRHTASLARFLDQLAAVPDGGGSLLDNTLVIYLSDQADGHHPSCFEWPAVLVGDLGGRLRTGNRYLRYPWYQNPGHRTTANLFNTLLHAAGAPRQRFGLPDESLPDIDQDSPLDELLA